MNKNVSSQRVPNKLQNRDVNAAQRVALAVSLRAQKLTFDEIAQRVGYGSASACRKAILRELERTISTNVEELRREEILILDKLQQRCMEKAMDPTNKGFLFAVDRVISIRERMGRLMGLDQTQDNVLNAGMVVVREAPPGLLGESHS